MTRLIGPGLLGLIWLPILLLVYYVVPSERFFWILLGICLGNMISEFLDRTFEKEVLLKDGLRDADSP